jgi:hypothetical protein
MGKNKKNKCYLRRQEKFIENMRITGVGALFIFSYYHSTK